MKEKLAIGTAAIYSLNSSNSNKKEQLTFVYIFLILRSKSYTLTDRQL